MHVARTKAYVHLQECIAKVVSDRTHFVTLSKRELLVSRCPLTSQFALILAPEDDLILQSLHPGFLLQTGQRSDSNNNSKRNRELACSSNSSTSSHSSRDLAAATSSSVWIWTRLAVTGSAHAVAVVKGCVQLRASRAHHLDCQQLEVSCQHTARQVLELLSTLQDK